MRIVLVGGSGGIGKEIAPLLSQKRTIASNPKIQIQDEVIQLSSQDIDLRNLYSIDQYFYETDSMDVLINLATISRDGLVEKLSQDDIDRSVEINIVGAIRMYQRVIEKMRIKGFGRIIYFSSILSDFVVPGTGLYAACKGFNEKLMTVAAHENAKYKITCNTIQLGYSSAGMINTVPEKVLEKIIKTIPCHRLCTPQEIVHAISYIIHTPYVNGSITRLNGGLAR